MVQKVQGVQDGEFLISEANGHRSRENAVVSSGQNLPAGQVVLDNGGTLEAYSGTGTAVGILWAAVDATSTPTPGAIITRDAEVSAALITGWDAAAATALATIQVRTA